jgi:small-conductance mechanosensitive channel
LNKTQENRIRVIARYTSQIEKANSTKIALLEQVSTEKIEEKIVKFDKKMAKIIQRRDKWAVKQEKNVIKFKDNISKNETKFAARVKKTSENNVRWSNKFHNSMKKREARTNKWGTNVQDKARKYLRKLEKNITRFRAQLVNQDKCLTKIERNEQIAQIQGLDAYSCPTSIVGTECSGSGNCLTFVSQCYFNTLGVHLRAWICRGCVRERYHQQWNRTFPSRVAPLNSFFSIFFLLVEKRN